MPPKSFKSPGYKPKVATLSDNETTQIYPPDLPPPPIKLPRVSGYSDERMRQLQEEVHPVVLPLKLAETLQFNEAWVKLFPKGVPVDDETLMGINHIDHQLLFGAFMSLLSKYPFLIRQGFNFFELNVIAFKYNINAGFSLPQFKDFTFVLNTERIRDLRVALPTNHSEHGDIYRRFLCYLLQVLANPNLDTLFLDLEADFHFPYPMLDLYLSSPRSAGLHRLKIGVKDGFFAQHLIRGISTTNTDLQLICFDKCKTKDAIACTCKIHYLGMMDPGYDVLGSPVLVRNNDRDLRRRKAAVEILNIASLLLSGVTTVTNFNSLPRKSQQRINTILTDSFPKPPPRWEEVFVPGCFVTLNYRRETAGFIAHEPAITKDEVLYILKNSGLINRLLKCNATSQLHENPKIAAQIIWDVLLRAPSPKQLAAQEWERGTTLVT